MVVLRQQALLYGYVATLLSYIRSLIFATFDYRKFCSETERIINNQVLKRKETFLKNINFLYGTKSWGVCGGAVG